VKSHKGKCREKVVHMHAMKAYRGVEVQLHSFVTWVLDEGEWSASRLSYLAPAKRAPTTPRHSRLGRCQGQSGCCGEQKNLLAWPGIKTWIIGGPVHSPVSYTPYTNAAVVKSHSQLKNIQKKRRVIHHKFLLYMKWIEIKLLNMSNLDQHKN
jgi:hypothetical protein